MMKAPEFSVGDVVVLRSGGLPMTVVAARPGWPISLPTHFDCAWFDEAGKLGRASFTADALVLKDPPKSMEPQSGTFADGVAELLQGSDPGPGTAV